MTRLDHGRPTSGHGRTPPPEQLQRRTATSSTSSCGLSSGQCHPTHPCATALSPPAIDHPCLPQRNPPNQALSQGRHHWHPMLRIKIGQLECLLPIPHLPDSRLCTRYSTHSPEPHRTAAATNHCGAPPARRTWPSARIHGTHRRRLHRDRLDMPAVLLWRPQAISSVHRGSHTPLMRTCIPRHLAGKGLIRYHPGSLPGEAAAALRPSPYHIP